jgi:hypothetical protein
VLLRSVDLENCEDLGRQLRELRSDRLRAEQFEIWTPLENVEAITAFARTERIDVHRVRGIELERAFSMTNIVSTPAALVLSPNGEILAGVSHLTVVPGARIISFADELRSRL